MNKVFFYTADEYCAFWHDENSQYPEDIGLLVFSDLNFEKEIRPIESFPYEYTSIERKISVSDVEDFLETSKSFTEFNEVFGSPNAKGKLWSCFYEIIEIDGSTKYLEVGVPDGENITYVSIVGEFDYIRGILDEEEY